MLQYTNFIVQANMSTWAPNGSQVGNLLGLKWVTPRGTHMDLSRGINWVPIEQPTWAAHMGPIMAPIVCYLIMPAWVPHAVLMVFIK